jgi:aminoglycoside 6-adenylyltransferase
MRTEQEMMDLILNFARRDERVRVVTMEGSRLNRDAPVDSFQDYDISFVVTDMGPYLKNDAWLDYFGKRIIMQKPQSMSLFSPAPAPPSCLMLYEDGNRIDLTLRPLGELDRYLRSADSLTQILLDRDGRCPPRGEPSDRDYHVKKPSAEYVDNCCNEFWWLSTYVAKGLCRNEILYALHHLELMRTQLLTMISWEVGARTGYAVSVGKSCKYLRRYVSPARWEQIMRCCGLRGQDSLWEALRDCCALFQEVSGNVSALVGCPLPAYGAPVSAYLDRLQATVPGGG